MAVATRPRTRRSPLLDRALGTSRRRRQAAYLALGAAFTLLRPTLRRLAGMASAMFLVLSLLVLYVAIRRS